MEQKKAKKTITLSIKIVDNKTKNVENIKTNASNIITNKTNIGINISLAISPNTGISPINTIIKKVTIDK